MAVIKVNQLGTARQKARNLHLPVTEPIPNSNQVTNSDGGFVWQVNDWDRLDRFLILGCEGGTYYVTEPDLLKTSHEAVDRCLKLDGLRTLKHIVDISVAGRAYRNDPAIFALAIASGSKDLAVRTAVYDALPEVCRTGTHLYHFAMYADALRGWGRGLRTAVARWFTTKNPDALAYQLVKYQRRDGWSARDMLRKAHPKANNSEQDALFRWVVSGLKGLEREKVERKRGAHSNYSAIPFDRLPALVMAFEKAKTASEKDLVKLILEQRLPREAIPTEKLNSLPVWEALLDRMPMTAMIRNLGKMTSIGLVKPLSAATSVICDRLRNADYLKKSRIHPIAVLMALKVYNQDHGEKGSLTWNHVPAISAALNDAFYACFGNVRPCNKPLLIGLDVSGSMSWSNGTCITSAEAVGAMSLIWASVEPTVHIFGFSDRLTELGIHKGMDLVSVMKIMERATAGSTNAGLAIEYAIQNRLKVGSFITMTDNEVNCGAHPAKRLQDYRQEFVPDARFVVAATTATSFTINDPNDKFGMDVCGFDASVPAVITDFMRGEPAPENAQSSLDAE